MHRQNVENKLTRSVGRHLYFCSGRQRPRLISGLHYARWFPAAPVDAGDVIALGYLA